MSDRYSLKCVNDGGQPMYFYVYQKLAGSGSDQVSLVWLAGPSAYPGGGPTEYNWETSYEFVWGQTGSLTPGSIFTPGGSVPCDPSGANSTTFKIDGAPTFTPPAPGACSGLCITVDSSVPSGQYAVGIGMGNSAANVAPAQPNTMVAFGLPPAYWVAAAQQGVQVGQVLAGNVPMAAQVSFPPGGGSMTATFQPDNTWKIAPGN